MTTARDEFFMARALNLARKGIYTTDPNPRVGCVITKDDTIIGEGWHAKAGGDHAEIAALTNALKDSSLKNALCGATVYVTLEPCSHFGKTPPCCDALISAKVNRVVVAMQDPNPLVSGRGLKKLQAAGIEVCLGILSEDAKKLNRGFITRMAQQRPFVYSKLAMSLDGRTAPLLGTSRWITSEEARADVQKLRAESSAILTGIDTVLADDPAMNSRITEDILQPMRVIVDSHLRTPVAARMARLPGRKIILTCAANPIKQQQLQYAGFEIYQLPEKDQHVDLPAVMDFMAKQEVNQLLVEAGATLNGALLAEDLVDEYIVYMAPCVLGDQGRGLFRLPHAQRISDKKQLKLVDMKQIGPDLKLIFNRDS